MKVWQIASLSILGIGTVYAVTTMATGGGDVGKERTGKFAGVERTPTQLIEMKKEVIAPVYAPVYSPIYHLAGGEEPETKKEATSGGGYAPALDVSGIVSTISEQPTTIYEGATAPTPPSSTVMPTAKKEATATPSFNLFRPSTWFGGTPW